MNRIFALFDLLITASGGRMNKILAPILSYGIYKMPDNFGRTSKRSGLWWWRMPDDGGVACLGETDRREFSNSSPWSVNNDTDIYGNRSQGR